MLQSRCSQRGAPIQFAGWRTEGRQGRAGFERTNRRANEQNTVGLDRGQGPLANMRTRKNGWLRVSQQQSHGSPAGRHVLMESASTTAVCSPSGGRAPVNARQGMVSRWGDSRLVHQWLDGHPLSRDIPGRKLKQSRKNTSTALINSSQVSAGEELQFSFRKVARAMTVKPLSGTGRSPAEPSPGCYNVAGASEPQEVLVAVAHGAVTSNKRASACEKSEKRSKLLARNQGGRHWHWWSQQTLSHPPTHTHATPLWRCVTMCPQVSYRTRSMVFFQMMIDRHYPPAS